MTTVKKKICFLVGYYPIYRGGAEYQSLLIAESLKEQYEVVFISADYQQETVLVDNGFTIYTLKTFKLPKIRPFYFFQGPKLEKLLKTINPDIIYHRSLTANIGVAAKFCREHGKKLVWHIASTLDLSRKDFAFNRDMLFDFLESRRINYGIRNADVIFAQTNDQALHLEQKFKRKADLVIYNFHPEATTEMEKPGEYFNVIWIGNLKPAKQPEVFIKLAERFAGMERVRFMMVGRKAPKRFQRFLEEEMEKVSNIEYKGELSIQEVNSLLAGAHVLVNTSLFEGFSNTFIQAWKHKVPVVSLHVDPDELLTREKIGVKARDFDNLVQQVGLLIENRTITEDMGRRAKEFAAKAFHMRNINLISDRFKSMLHQSGV